MKAKRVISVLLVLCFTFLMLCGCDEPSWVFYTDDGYNMTNHGTISIDLWGFAGGCFVEKVVFPTENGPTDEGYDYITVAGFATEPIKEVSIFCESKKGSFIYSKAFFACSELKIVELSNCYSIKSKAFAYCAEGLEITINDLTPPHYSSQSGTKVNGQYVWEYTEEESDWKAFEGIEDFKIFVPAQAVEAYKNALGWRLYADHIFAIEE